MVDFSSLRTAQTQRPDGKSHAQTLTRSQIREIDRWSKTRLSKNFIVRDFLFSTECAVMGLSNLPEDPAMVVCAGKALCDKVLEPVLSQFGQFGLTFGYQCRKAIEATLRSSGKPVIPHSSSPHQWDRKTWGEDVYARVDILPYCVEDGLVAKHDFARWIMWNLDIDLLMAWTRSNVFCITISPKPRRVYLQWGDSKKGEARQTILMGAKFWKDVYPTLPANERPRFGPSCTGGAMQWRSK